MGLGNESLLKWFDHMTKMVAIPIYGKNLKKILLSMMSKLVDALTK